MAARVIDQSLPGEVASLIIEGSVSAGVEQHGALSVGLQERSCGVFEGADLGAERRDGADLVYAL